MMAREAQVEMQDVNRMDLAEATKVMA